MFRDTVFILLLWMGRKWMLRSKVSRGLLVNKIKYERWKTKHLCGVFFSGKPRIAKEMDESSAHFKLGCLKTTFQTWQPGFGTNWYQLIGEKGKENLWHLCTIEKRCHSHWLENCELRVKEKNNILDEADKVESINHLLLKLDRSLLPDGVLENMIENNLIFFTISYEIKPTFSSFVCLKDDLLFTAWRGGVKIPCTKFSHITRSHNIHRCSQVINSGLITEYWHENRMEFPSLQKGDEGIKYYCAGFVAHVRIVKHCLLQM